MNLLITGIGGFIGSRAAQLAAANGWRVRGLEISPTRAERLREQGFEVVIGSTDDPLAAATACDGIEAIVHTAALVVEDGDWVDVRRVNVEGTLTVARAAHTAGVSTFVHLSSVMVYGFRYPHGIDETGPRRGENNPYCQTKIEGEEALMALDRETPMRILMVRAGDVYGPGSVPWVVRPLKLMKMGLFALPNGGRGVMNHVYIDNLVAGIFTAITGPTRYAIYNLTDGHVTTWREYFSRLAEIGGLPPPRSLPAPLIRLAVTAMAKILSVRGKEPPALPAGVDFINRLHAVSIARAQTDLNFTPQIGLDEGMARTASWLRSEEGHRQLGW